MSHAMEFSTDGLREAYTLCMPLLDDGEAPTAIAEAFRIGVTSLAAQLPCYRSWAEWDEENPSAWIDYDCIRGGDEQRCPACSAKTNDFEVVHIA